jgi:hypothetical protein
MRFEALLIARILIPGGFVVLWATLSEAGERFYSLLGFAATMLAGPLMLIFGTFQLALTPFCRPVPGSRRNGCCR